VSKAPDLLYEVVVAPDGACHVQDVHRFALGPHSVYGAASYARWRKGVPDGVPVEEREAACDCGLALGQVREINGMVRVDPRIADRGADVPKPAPAIAPKAAPREEATSATVDAPPTEGAVEAKGEKDGRKEANMAKAKAKGRIVAKKAGSTAARKAWAARRAKYGANGLSAAALKRRGAHEAPATPAST